MANVVFILGAGLSANAGFPTAKALVNDMINIPEDPRYKGMIEHETIWRADTERIQQRRHLFESLHVIKQMENPIDFLLETNSDLQEMGSFHIAYALLNAEQRHKDSRDPHYYTYLFSAIDVGHRRARKCHICSYITLNYDRSLEYAFSRFCRVFKVDYFNNRHLLNVHHLHGSFGELDSDKAYGYQGPAGATPQFHITQSAAKRIRTTYSDSDDQNDAYKKAADMIGSANVVVVIGTSLDPVIFRKLRQSIPYKKETLVHCYDRDERAKADFKRRAAGLLYPEVSVSEDEKLASFVDNALDIADNYDTGK